MSEDEVLAKKLRAYRYKKGLSQGELAKQVGVSQETIGNIERQKIKPSLDTMEKIAEYFGITLSDLLDTQEDWKSKRAKAAGVWAAFYKNTPDTFVPAFFVAIKSCFFDQML